MPTLTLNVCQGVGDIFWVYQKFAPHVDRINFRVIHLDKSISKIQNRSVEFLKLLPKVEAIGINQRLAADYDRIARARFSMADIFRQFRAGQESVFDYACNGPLEAGVRLDEIDSDFPIEETVPLLMTPATLPYPSKRYLVLYVSGSVSQRSVARKLKLWTAADWVRFVERFQTKYQLRLPIVIIGAEYDRGVAVVIGQMLTRLKRKVTIYIDQKPAHLVHLIQNAKCFLGYQSGLNILADNLNVPQVMLYFPYLKPMLYTWCKRSHLDGFFNAATFDQRPETVLSDLEMRFD